MANVGEATAAEMQAGGRTIEEILEDMRQNESREPGLLSKAMGALKNKGIQALKSAAQKSFKAYVGFLKDALDDTGMIDDLKDKILAGEVGQMMDGFMDSASEVAVNGLSREERAEFSSVAPQAEQQKQITAPSAADTVKMHQAQEAAAQKGHASKNLMYTEDQLRQMPPEEVKKAAVAGLADGQTLGQVGYDAAELTKGANRFYDMAPTNKVIKVAKLKVLPEYMKNFETAGEELGIVMREDDMTNKGVDNYFGHDDSWAKDTVQGVANATVGVGSQEVSKADLSKARGAMAHDELHMDVISQNALYEAPGFSDFSKG